ncbi:permease [Sphingomonas sp.]|uniref:permease n=1 Tax=Sphingomonas sp. TaxID=28214 RepID=UPI003CC5790D
MTAARAPASLMALFVMLGFSAGLPFFMFSTVLGARLQAHGVDIVTIGLFGAIILLPTFKFLWAPLVDQVDVPGFARFFGRRRGWLMLAQLGIAASLGAMALTSADRSLAVTALLATLAAFWTTTLEVAADGWRIELAPGQAGQGRLTAANLWGYRSAMMLSSTAGLVIADRAGWAAAYGVVAGLAALPFPVLAALARDPHASGRRGVALGIGIGAAAAILLASAAVLGVAGWLLLGALAAAGVAPGASVTPVVLALCLLPFVAMAFALPRIERLGPDAPLRTSAAAGPYVDFFWRYGRIALLLLAFVSVYRMGDVLTNALSTLVRRSRGYSLTQIGVADGVVALAASLIGVAIGGWATARWPLGRALALGALASAVGNWVFVWLWRTPPSPLVLYVATGLDQGGHGLAGAVFVVYLSLLVNPRFPAAQYALLSGFAFLLPRLIAVAAGAIQVRIGYDGFFLLSGALSAAGVLFLPLVLRAEPRHDEEPA